MNKRNDREATILRERRIALGLTQGQVATEAGIELQTYQRYEYGKLRLSGATMKTGLRICAALELDPFEAAACGLGKSAEQHGLSGPGNILQKDMAAAKIANSNRSDLFLLSDEKARPQ